ncbi:MAG: alpha/beta hydrolase fold domain-containing protein, partial [Acetobacteraceae bacterium]|nr:alpha/beta hydrolase fold domain-containing protein [Acetobacteraceae bacterium]
SIYGEYYRCGHRADLLESLLRSLPGESVRAQSRVVALEETDHDVAVELETGEVIRGDLLIGADGLNSRVRTLLFGEQEARFTGTVVWRGLMPRAKVSADYSEHILSWLGPRRHVLVYPLRHAAHPQSVFSLSAFVPADEVHRESWTASGDIDDLRESLEGACPAIGEMLDVLEDALITGIYFRDPVERWGTERAVLLGDAAHPAPPNAGQGAGMALEDAVMLSACLERHGPGNTRAALAEYVYRRRRRTTRMLEASRVSLRNSQTSDPAQVRARNGYYRGLRRLNPVAAPMAEWLLGHDPVRAAQQTSDEFEAAQMPPANPMRRPEAQRAYAVWQGALSLEDRSSGWLGERTGYDRFLRRELPAPADLRSEVVDCDGVRAVRVGVYERSPETPIVVHLHGGGYVMGSADASLELAGRLAAAIGGWALVPDYRLAPEEPFPAALDDVLACYRWVVAAFPSAPVYVFGECAGGGLALALCLDLRGSGERMPDAVHVVSPFVDLGVREELLNLQTRRDPWLNRVMLTQLAACYVQDADLVDPRLSPIDADLRGLPPLLIHAAADEALCPSARALAERATSAGVRCELDIVEDSVHSFVLFPFLPETEKALRSFSKLSLAGARS